MDYQIEKIIEIEKSGDYKKALDEYLKINPEKLAVQDKIFLDRSIAACFFYLKEYKDAEKAFNKILKKYDLDLSVKKEISECINLCYLYGNKEKKAEKYFLNKLKINELSDDEKCWCYWYLGQCSFLMKKYKKMENFYNENVTLALKMNHERISFFCAHLIISEILNKNYEEIEKNLRIVNKMEDRSNGLLKIGISIYNKIKGKKDWENLYNEGIIEAKNAKYIENVELGEFLVKNSKSDIKAGEKK